MHSISSHFIRFASFLMIFTHIFMRYDDILILNDDDILLHISHDILSYSIRKMAHFYQNMLKFPKSPDPKITPPGMLNQKTITTRHEQLSFRTSLESDFRTMAELS